MHTFSRIIDGHDIKAELKPVHGDVIVGLENTIGAAKRRVARNYNPGDAIAVVMGRCIEKLTIDGRQIDWKDGSEEFPLIYDEESDDTLAEMLLKEVVNMPKNKILLKKEVYREVFGEYKHKHSLDDPVEDPT